MVEIIKVPDSLFGTFLFNIKNANGKTSIMAAGDLLKSLYFESKRAKLI